MHAIATCLILAQIGMKHLSDLPCAISVYLKFCYVYTIIDTVKNCVCTKTGLVVICIVLQTGIHQQPTLTASA